MTTMTDLSLGNRKSRRAIAARKRTTITKHTPFGRIAVTALVTDIEGTRDRIEYIHMGKGRMSRVLTDQFLMSLQCTSRT